ncbi:MAG: hypothetical protein H7A25_17305 [Leptospiraceae bacterium]|nr:hypothetical protein [Leptospiraceae bacterium]MCP5501663.1 hypothetical protein [Leptospiraceae bacterium]
MDIPLCPMCKHYTGHDNAPVCKRTHTCKAFPNGIPLEIIFNKIQHTNSIPGDNGYLFELL